MAEGRLALGLDWHAFTWLGDSSLLMPGAVLIALWLAVARRTWPVAGLWVALFGAGSLLVLASKLAFMGWGLGSARLDFTGFSGHTAFATSIWPVALWLMASRWGHRARATAAGLGWALGAAIGGSRVLLDAHSLSEVVAGYLLGLAVSVGFLTLQRRHAPPQLRAWLVLPTLLLPLAWVPPGQPAPTQDVLEVLAMRLAGTDRPFRREDLHRAR